MDNASPTKQILFGVLLMVFGIFMLLYTLGLIEAGFSLIFGFMAIAAILYGAYISGIYDLIRGYLQKKNK